MEVASPPEASPLSHLTSPTESDDAADGDPVLAAADLDADRAWSSAEVAFFLRISPRHLADCYKNDPTFPQPVMLGTRARWAPESIRNWLAAGGKPVAARRDRPQRARSRHTGAFSI